MPGSLLPDKRTLRQSFFLVGLKARANSLALGYGRHFFLCLGHKLHKLLGPHVQGLTEPVGGGRMRALSSRRSLSSLRCKPYAGLLCQLLLRQSLNNALLYQPPGTGKRRRCYGCSVRARLSTFKRSGTMNERYGSAHRDREPEQEDFEEPRES